MGNNLDRFNEITMPEEEEITIDGANTARLLAGRYLPMAITALMLFFVAKLMI